jgi:DNA-binding transcriptional regulator YiaG
MHYVSEDQGNTRSLKMSSMDLNGESNLSHSLHRAKRLKRLRDMSGLSRDAIKKTHDIARGTLQNWETARFGGLTTKGAKIMIKVFNSEGIQTTIDWLLHGIGSEPKYTNSNATHQLSTINYIKTIPETEHNSISQELIYFRMKYSDVADSVITDDSMSPYYKEGDFIAGIKHYKNNLTKAIWKNCIIQTYEHGILIKYLRPSNQIGKYDLWSHNIKSSQNEIAKHGIEIISAAPIIWVRRPSHLQAYFTHQTIQANECAF